MRQAQVEADVSRARVIVGYLERLKKFNIPTPFFFFDSSTINNRQ